MPRNSGERFKTMKFVYFLLCLIALLGGYTNQADEVGLLVPAAEILAQLGHITDELVRNITAVQIHFCPTSPLCTINIENLDLQVTKKHTEAAQQCCSDCSCTADCIEKDTCCVDYNEDIKDNAIHDDDVDDMYECIHTLYRESREFNSLNKKWLIKQCPNQNTFEVAANKRLCEMDYREHWFSRHYKYGVPVTDKTQLRSYKNMFCALCHGLVETDVIFWTPSVQGHFPFIFQGKSLENVVQMLEEYSSVYNLAFLPPSNIPVESYTCIYNACNLYGGWLFYDAFIVQGCLYYKSLYQNQFRNLFCATCNGFQIEHDTCTTGTGGGFDFPFSYIGILDFNILDPAGSQDLSSSAGAPKCPSGYLWDKITMGCRELQCSTRSILVNNECQLFYSQVKGYTFSVHLFFVDTEPRPFTAHNVEKLYQNITTDINAMADNNLKKLNEYKFEYNTYFQILVLAKFQNVSTEKYRHVGSYIFGFSYITDFKILNESQIDVKHMTEELEKLHKIRTYKSFMQYNYGQLFTFMTHNGSFSSTLNATFQSHFQELQYELGQSSHQNAFDLDRNEASSTAEPPSFFNNMSDIPFYDYTGNNSGFLFDFYDDMLNIDDNTTDSVIFQDFDLLVYPPYKEVHISLDLNIVQSIPLCTQVKFDVGEFMIIDNKFIIQSINLTLFSDQCDFCKDDWITLCVCVETYEEGVRQYLATNPSQETKDKTYVHVYSAETITSLTMSSISVLFNIMTLMVYLILKHLRTTPGLITMSLTFHLLVFQAIYVVSNSIDITPVKQVCIGTGIVFHFSFLSYIFWMNISTFHMHQTFTKTGINFFNRSRFHPKKLLFKYSLYVYLLATAFVALNLLVSLATTNWTEFGYGLTSCYINTPLMTGLTVGIPLGLVLMSNMYFFVYTMFFVVRGLDLSMARTGGIEDKQYLVAFFKLSILTGVTWVLGLIHQWTDVSITGYFYIVLNAGQGILIFLSFVCNSQVFRMIKAKLIKQ